MFCINFQTKTTTSTIFDLVDILTLLGLLLRLIVAISLTDCFTETFISLSLHFHLWLRFVKCFIKERIE